MSGASLPLGSLDAQSTDQAVTVDYFLFNRPGRRARAVDDSNPGKLAAAVQTTHY